MIHHYTTLYTTQHDTSLIQYNTSPYNTLQHYTSLYNTTQQNTVKTSNYFLTNPNSELTGLFVCTMSEHLTNIPEAVLKGLHVIQNTWTFFKN